MKEFTEKEVRTAIKKVEEMADGSGAVLDMLASTLGIPKKPEQIKFKARLTKPSPKKDDWGSIVNGHKLELIPQNMNADAIFLLFASNNSNESPIVNVMLTEEL